MISRALTMLSDERLAQLAAAGNDPAFSTLYNRYSGTLFAYCRSITRNVDDGWDALQNAMIKVLVALRRTPGRSAPVRPWLFCICHNEAVGILRKRSAAERVAGASTCTTVAGADEEALVREVVSEVVSDVQQLPTGQRAALVMRELADLRYDEIAIALETTEGNARQLVFAAREGLRDSRAGRGLPCESVRDQLSLADGRLLRRRSVRAHLRTCDGCREYAVSVRRRAPQPARALSAWSPLAGYQLLESVFRAAATGPGAAALAQGGSSLFGPLALKVAAATAVLATGIAGADVATMKPETAAPDRAAPGKVARTAAPSKAAAAATISASSTPGSSVHARIVSAVYTGGRSAAGTTKPARARSSTGGSKRASRSTAGSSPAADPAPRNDAASPRDPAPRHDDGGQQPRAAREQADCNGRQQQADSAPPPPAQAAPADDSDAGTRRDVAFTGDAARPPRDEAGGRPTAPPVADAR